MSGMIKLITGPMRGGKSTELIRQIERYNISGKKCIVIKHSLDNRYGTDDYITCHNHTKLKCIQSDDNNIDYVLKNMDKNINVVGIDEGQFFKNIAVVSEELANQGKIVIISALIGTWERKKFFNILDIFPLCESITFLPAVCNSCGNDASFNKRIISFDGDVHVGGDESYISVCRKCYFLI